MLALLTKGIKNKNHVWLSVKGNEISSFVDFKLEGEGKLQSLLPVIKTTFFSAPPPPFYLS